MQIIRIPITAMQGFRIGNAQDYDAMTGVTVILLDHDNRAGVGVFGGGPAMRENMLLSPYTATHPINAIVLSGGSAYGLDAAGGVMRYLEERGKGYEVRGLLVPLVCQSSIFDLTLGNPKVRPDADMAYAACLNAELNHPISGMFGAGCGATVGKICGIERAFKSGVGYFAIQLGDLQVAAVTVVNAFGDVRDPLTGQIIAGALDENRKAFIDTESEMLRLAGLNTPPLQEEGGNTTLSVILTNARFDKADMNRIAHMAVGAYDRCIFPNGTSYDGDTIYAVSVAPFVTADYNLVGTLAVQVLSEAILDAVKNSYMEENIFLQKARHA